MARWFRFYEDALDDPKVQRLSGDAFKVWVNILCVASRNSGLLPARCDLAFALRKSEKAADEAVAELVAAGLIDMTDAGPTPHNWSGRQYVSDTSYERVKRHRGKRSEAGLLSQWQPTPEMRTSIYERDGNACVYCGSSENLTIDHRVPELRGGTNETDNLQTACRQCNASKRDLTHEEFVNRNAEKPLQKRPQSSEQNQSRAEQKERATRSGSRLPDDWQPSAEDRAFAGDFDIDVDSVASVFRDYWHAVAGAKGRKTDWSATWRNWVRREAEGKKTRATRPALNGHTAASTFVDDGSQWSARLRGWQQSKFWKPYDWGPEPGVYGCLVPPALLEKVA